MWCKGPWRSRRWATTMYALEGSSALHDGAAAAAEATRHWTETPEMLFVFCSSEQDSDAVARTLAARFPGVPMVGCSTAGEHLAGQHSRGSLVVAGLCDTGVDWVVDVFDGLDGLDDDAGEAFAQRLFAQHGVTTESTDSRDFVALMFVDGLSRAEERVSAALASGLGGVPLAGGSAGDDLAFQRTTVICNGTAAGDRVALVLARSRGTKFRVVKHQHFVAEPQMLAVTRADTDQRRVYELDGYPAAEAYAKAIGVDPSDLDGEVSFLHPVTFSCDDQLYVRSIQSINDDGSLTFFCAIEEGMVLQLGSHEDMEAALNRELEGLRDVDFLLEFNCVLRALEATNGDRWPALGRSVNEVAKSSIGFDTYGEQLNGLHINQTLVAVAFSSGEDHSEVRA